MYVERMIAEVPRSKPYSKRHLESVDAAAGPDQRGADDGAGVRRPGGDPSAQRDPGLDHGDDGRVRRLPRSADQRHAQEDPGRVVRVPEQQRLAVRAERLAARLEVRRGAAGRRHRAVRARPGRRALGLRLVERLLHPPLQATARARSPRRTTTRSSSARASRRPTASDRRPAPGPLLDQEPAVLAGGHAGRRRIGRAVRRRDRLPGVPERHELPPVAQPRGRDDRACVRPGGHLLLGGRLRGRRMPSSRRTPRATSPTWRPERSSSSRPTTRSSGSWRSWPWACPRSRPA